MQDNVLRGFGAKNPGCLASLSQLDLSNNGISSLGANFTQLMDSATHLRRLNLSENPFNCNCYLLNFVHWFKVPLLLLSQLDKRFPTPLF